MIKKHTFLMCLLACFTVCLCVIILASVPPVSRDALTHHLIVPKLYLGHGGIFEIPYIEFSYYPMNLQLLYMIPLYLGNDIVPKYIHFLFAILSALLIYSYLKEKTNRNWGVFGALFFLTIPVIVKLSITVYVDLGLVFFSLGSLLSILKWREKQFQLRYLIFSSVFCGLAMGTKYNGLIVFFLMAMVVPVIYLRSEEAIPKRQLNALNYCTVFIVISLLVVSPWMVRNVIWTGNPIYPLYNEILNFISGSNAEKISVTSYSGGWGHFAVRKVIYGEKWWEILLIPIRIFFQGTDNNPKYFDGVLYPFLIILPFFAFNKKEVILENGISDKLIFFAFSFFYIMIVFLKQDMRIRWIGPAIPPLVMLSVIALNKSYYNFSQSKFRQFLSVSICMVVVFSNAFYLAGQFKKVKPLEYISGEITRAEYIKQFWPEVSVLNYANKNIKKENQILAFFLGNRRYYSNHKMIFDHDMYKKVVQNAKNPDQIIEDLRYKGFTNIVVNYALFNQWAEKQFLNNEKHQVKEFFNRIKLLYAHDGFGFYEI